MLQLSKPAQLNAYVQPVLIPDEGTPPFSGTCTVSGWGVTQVYSNVLSPVLRAVDVREIPYCTWYYRNRIKPGMVCAGSLYGGKDSCQVYIHGKHDLFCVCGMLNYYLATAFYRVILFLNEYFLLNL